MSDTDPLQDVKPGDPYLDVHNEERHAINAIETLVNNPTNPVTPERVAATLSDPLVSTPLSAAYAAVVAVPLATGVTATDWANISAAVTKAQAIRSSGGQPIVAFPACPIVSGSLVPYSIGANSIPLVDGVRYRGVEPSVREDQEAQGTYMPDSDFHYVAGTVIQGDGTAPGMTDGKVDQVSPDANVGATQYCIPSITGFGFQNVSHGIKTGAKNVMGLVWSDVDGIYARACGWGVWFKNYQHISFGRIRTCASTVGHMYFATDMTGGNWGNSSYDYLFARRSNGTGSVRGIVFESVDGSNGHTIGHASTIQVNAFNMTSVSQTATLTSGSSSIAVTDGTKFAVGMPVTFTSTVGGFTSGVVYVVASVSGNTLTLANSKHESVISASASGTPTITTNGFASIEFATTSASAGNVVGTVGLLDAEGNPTVGLYSEYFQNSSVRYGTLSGTAAGIVARHCTITRYHNATQSAADFDSFSTTATTLDGTVSTFTQRAVAGGQYNPTRQAQAFAVGNLPAGNMGGHLEARSQGWLYPTFAGIGEHVYVRASNITLSASNCGQIISEPASAFTVTLPTINTAGGSSMLNANVGAWYEIWNMGTATITVNTQSSQTFNKVAGKTSTTIAPGYKMRMLAVEASSMYWVATQVQIAALP